MPNKPVNTTLTQDELRELATRPIKSIPKKYRKQLINCLQSQVKEKDAFIEKIVGEKRMKETELFETLSTIENLKNQIEELRMRVNEQIEDNDCLQEEFDKEVELRRVTQARLHVLCTWIDMHFAQEGRAQAMLRNAHFAISERLKLTRNQD